MQFFLFNDTATTEIYTLSLHDALPIFGADREIRARAFEQARGLEHEARHAGVVTGVEGGHPARHRDRIEREDRKSTRLNSSHSQISYAVFCLKKKKK